MGRSDSPLVSGGGKSKKKQVTDINNRIRISNPLQMDRDNDNPPVSGGRKTKKKALMIDDAEEYSFGTKLSEGSQVLEEEKPLITSKKKGANKSSQPKLESDGKLLRDEGDNEIAFAGKKKSKGKKSLFAASSGISVIADGVFVDKENGVDDECSVNFTWNKKSSKGGKKAGGSSVFTGFSVLDENEHDDVKDDNDDDFDSTITFSGKKKKKSSKSTKKSDDKCSMALLDDEEDEEEASVSNETIGITDGKELDDDAEEEEEGEEEDGSLMAFTGKKKSSKNKGSSNKSTSQFATLIEEKEGGEAVVIVNVAAEQLSVTESSDAKVKKSEDVAETSKNKKKKKKSRRTVQEEDDIDKILPVPGEAPSVPKSSPTEEKVQVQLEPVIVTEDKDGEDEKEESAASKKKRKKKEKEKEKKAASQVKDDKVEGPKDESKKGDAKVKAVGKKSAKGIRRIQELVARQIELEEIKAREEEERQRKQEEERLRLEELERQAEEAKRRKKEKEKEKILKKKQEGRYLTAKQRLEEQRLEAFRKQLLGDNSGLPVVDKGEAAPTKRPIYKSKKSKPDHKQANSSTSTVNGVEDEEMEKEEEVEEKVEDVETEKVEEEVEKGAEVEDEDEDEGDDAWDAKSWDAVSLTVKGAFDDEEVDSEPEPTVEDAKTVTVATRVAGPASLRTNEVQQVQTRQNQPGSRRKVSGGAETGGSTSDMEENLRSPICCIMGHVDTGKTKLLDCIRGTNVQEGEAGGITQQIGATYFPAENIRDRTKELKADAKLKVPGLLVIDTPGHESFTNLRSRGSGLCDIAVLVVDIMHGLEPQTIDSLNLLKMRNTDFIIALNKVDRLYGWKVCRNVPIRKAIKQQSKDTQDQFKMMVKQIIFQFQEQGLNTALYYDNKEMGETYSIVPTSAISGEGIPDLLLLLVRWTEKTMVDKLTFSNEIQCTVLEVKVIEGHGTTIDVVLVNGVLHEGDQIVVCGLQGPIVTTIRALLTPHPMKELRVKGTYLHHKSIKAAQGIKISAQGLEHAIAGTSLYVVGCDDDLEDVKESAMEDMKSVMSRIDRSGEGVYVQASTLGSLEALLEFLKSPEVKIPVSGIGIGPVHKKDVMKASVMLEKKKEYATILAFDVKVTPEAQKLADESGVKIFIADIIYHLFDQFKGYIEKLKEEKRKEAADEAVFPCIMKILPAYIFNNKDPIVLGVKIVEGIAKVGTPICIPSQDFMDIGRISSIKHDKKTLDTAKKGQQVSIKIAASNSEEQQKMYGRHFDSDDELVSHISRRSIDLLKENYRDDLSIEEWKLVVKLKNIFKIQ